MKIGQLATQTGVSRDTIRLYEQMGLLKNITRPYEYNNYKEYGDSNLERIQFILMMKKLGLTLKECKMVIEVIESGEFDQSFQNNFVKEKMKVIDEKIKELTTIRNLFAEHLNKACSQTDLVASIQQE